MLELALYYSFTILQYYYITVLLLYYSVTILQYYYYITVLLYYSITVLLLYYSVAILQCYYITVLLYYSVTILLLQYYYITGPILYGLSYAGALPGGDKVSFIHCMLFASIIVAVDPVAVNISIPAV